MRLCTAGSCLDDAARAAPVPRPPGRSTKCVRRCAVGLGSRRADCRSEPRSPGELTTSRGGGGMRNSSPPRRRTVEAALSSCPCIDTNRPALAREKINDFTIVPVYSYHSASMGWRRAARRAGQRLKKMPTAALKANARPTAPGDKNVFHPANLASAREPAPPSTIPNKPCPFRKLRPHLPQAARWTYR